MKPRRPLAVLCALAVLLAGCGDGARPRSAAPVEITISAAASLREAVTEVGRRYEAAHPGIAVRNNFAASGTLRQQIEQGAGVDVFVSAADRPMDALAARGRIEPASRRVVAGNELVLVAPRGTSAVRGWTDLASPAVRRVAIGAPASVPAGEYAEQTLRSLELWSAVAPKAVRAGSVRQVLAYVERGEVAAGVVYRTDAATSDGVRVVVAAPAGSHRAIVYPAAVVTGARNAAAAREYLRFFAGPEGRAVLRRHGFRVDGVGE